MLIIIPVVFTGCGCGESEKRVYLYQKGDIVAFNIDPSIKCQVIHRTRNGSYMIRCNDADGINKYHVNEFELHNYLGD